jgi:branched-chain amino acid transport system substrate-binding protein
MKKLLCIIVVLLTGFIICGCKQHQEAEISPSGKVVKIGVIAPMSGQDKKSGENALLGIRTALQIRPYLTNGDKIELAIEDNKGTSEDTLSALEKLSSQEDVSGVLLMAKSDAVLAVVPLADKYKIPILALIATHPDITKNNQYITQLGFDDIYQGTVAALHVRDEMFIDRVAVFSDPGNAHYSFLANEFIREYTSVGGEIVEHIIDGPETGDLQEILGQLRDNEVQLVYLAVKPTRVIQLVKAADAIGWKPLSMGSDGLLAAIMLRHSENLSLVDGMIATDFISTILPKTEYGQKAVKIFKKLFSEPGTTLTALGCEGTSILQHALDRCDNNTNRSCVNYMLRHTNEFEGLLGKLTIRDNGKTERPVFVNIIEDKALKFRVKVH